MIIYSMLSDAIKEYAIYFIYNYFIFIFQPSSAVAEYISAINRFGTNKQKVCVLLIKFIHNISTSFLFVLSYEQ